MEGFAVILRVGTEEKDPGSFFEARSLDEALKLYEETKRQLKRRNLPANLRVISFHVKKQDFFGDPYRA